MKKTLFMLVLACVMVFTMASCGGDGVKVYAGYYSTNIPEGFEVDKYESEFTRDSEAYPGYEDVIKINIFTGNAEDEINSSLEYWGDDHQRLDDVTYGDYTWLVETFTWNSDAPSCTFYYDLGDGNHVSVNFFMMAADSEEVTSIMESFTIQDNAYEKNQEFLGGL